MIRRFSVNFAVFSIFADLFIVAGTLWINEQIRPLLGFLPIVKAAGAQTLPLELFVLFPAVWVIISASFSVYDGGKNLRVVDEFTSLTFSAMLSSVALAGVMYLAYREVSRALFVVFCLTAFGALLLWRLAARPVYRRRQRAMERVRHVLIAGAGPVGMEVAARLRCGVHNGFEFAGFLDDDPQKHGARTDILGTLDDVRRVVRDHHIEDVVIALPRRAYARVNALAEALQDLPVFQWIIPDYFHITLHQARFADFAGMPMLDLRAAALTEYQRLIKRLFDILVVSVGLLFALPVMGVVALLIWVFDGRPILYSQPRAGENGRVFVMHKFRTMARGADKRMFEHAPVDAQGNPLHKRRNDPRVTPLGRILRRLSLDEFPQLFNIFAGEMSLVGPRPELPELVEQYQPWQRERFSVPQGLTGWWQIHGRSDRPMHLSTEDDLYYIRNFSFWLDVRILLVTFWIALRGKGAY